MSETILNTLKKVKGFIRQKGLEFDQYGLVKGGMLYVSNGFVQAQLPIDLPFDSVINLYQLQTLLSAVKNESVVIAKDNEILVQADDSTYKIDTLSIETFKWVDPTLPTETHNCTNPQVFKKCCELASDYVQPISNENAVNFAVEVMHVCNGVVSFTDRNNAFQFVLDYAMPNMALPLSSIVSIAKFMGKEEITGFNLVGDKLLIQSGEFSLFVPVLYSDQSPLWADKINNVINNIEKEKQVPVTITEHIKQQFDILIKLSRGKFIFFNNHFCSSDNNRIEYADFCEHTFAFKISTNNLKNVLSLTKTFNITEKNRMFCKTDNFRFVIGGILED